MTIKFTEFCRVVSSEQQETGPSLCSELSTELLGKYVKRAKKSVKDLEDGPYDGHKDDKAFKRKMYITYAQKERLKEEQIDELSSSTYHNYIRKANHVIDNTHPDSKARQKAEKGVQRADRLLNRKPLREEKIRHPEHKKAYVEPYESDGEPAYKASNRHGNLKFFNKHGKRSAYEHAGIELNEEIELQERELRSPAYLATVRWRRTKMPDVRHHKGKKMKGLVRTNKTQYVTRQIYKSRNQHDTQHLTTRSKHQLTDRWRDQRLYRVSLLKKNKNIHEDKNYLKNRQLLHTAHAQAGREIGKRERDPELKRIHLHRSRKHLHAAKVLEIIRKKKK